MTEGFQFKGVEELRANLREISRAPFLQREVAIQLFQEGQGLINKSQPLVPVAVQRLEAQREPHGLARSLEGEEEAVARAVDLAAAGLGQEAPHLLLVARDALVGRGITEPRLERRRVDQVGEDQTEQARPRRTLARGQGTATGAVASTPGPIPGRRAGARRLAARRPSRRGGRGSRRGTRRGRRRRPCRRRCARAGA